MHKNIETLKINNPYDNTVVGEVPLLNHKTLSSMIEGCANYNANLSLFERSSILMQAAQLLKTRIQEASYLITSETGLCVNDSENEVQRVIGLLELGSHLTSTLTFDHIYHSDNVANAVRKKIIVTYEPLRLISAITPFNHPMNQVAHKVIPSISTNNKIIIKPSLKAPLSAFYLQNLLYECGLPKEMFKVVTCSNQVALDTLVRSDYVDLVAFTGSYKVGEIIAKHCLLKKLILELGGCDPLIILQDANLELAVDLAVKGAFKNTGQRCTAVKKILVSNEIADKFIEAFLKKTSNLKYGDPFDKENFMGTLIDSESASYIHKTINDAINSGAVLIYGNKIKGAVLSPTIIDHTPLNHSIVSEEIFGPVAPIIRFSSAEEALDIANSSQYGLSAGVVTENLNIATYMIKNLKTGMVNINDIPGFRSEIAPFGGIKKSGLGIKEGLVESMRNFQNAKVYSYPW